MNSEVHLANGKRGRNSLRPLRGGGCCLPLRRKRERPRTRMGERENGGARERGRERDKGNTGLASTQFPSLASNFRRILPSHSITPLYQLCFSPSPEALSSFVPPFSIAIYIPGFPSRLAHGGGSRASPWYPNRLFLSPSMRPTKSRDSGLKYTVSALSPPIAIWLVN